MRNRSARSCLYNHSLTNSPFYFKPKFSDRKQAPMCILCRKVKNRVFLAPFFELASNLRLFKAPCGIISHGKMRARERNASANR
jgi:hypothetical protein